MSKYRANIYWVANEKGILPTGEDASNVVDTDAEPLLHICTVDDGKIIWAQSPNRAMMLAKKNSYELIFNLSLIHI